MKGVYLFGYGSTTVTLAELNTIQQWRLLHPELRARLIAMFDACPGPAGCGGGARTEAEQRALFLSRYFVVGSGGTIFFEGKWWRLKEGMASAAPPGLSYHEVTTPDGFALAIDVVGDQAWMGANAWRWKLHDFSDVNGELWHHQPVEIPNSRRQYVAQSHQLVTTGPTPVSTSQFAGFDAGDYGTLPSRSKSGIEEGSSGELVAYAQGVLQNEVSRFARWWAAGLPDDTTHAVAVRRLNLTLCANMNAVLKVDGTYGHKTFEAVRATQRAFTTTAFDEWKLTFDIDGRIGTTQTWPFLDALGDHSWGPST